MNLPCRTTPLDRPSCWECGSSMRSSCRETTTQSSLPTRRQENANRRPRSKTQTRNAGAHRVSLVCRHILETPSRGGTFASSRSLMKWITREKAKVDRVACPWLIKKFIDPQAEFLFVPSNQVEAKAQEIGATPYDIEG